MPKELSKRIRSTKRLLSKENLPQDARIERERQLAALQNEQILTRIKTREGKLERKYKMVKFFEQQKATRRLKQAEKELSQAETEEVRKRIAADIHKYRVDLSYIQVFLPLKVLCLMNRTFHCRKNISAYTKKLTTRRWKWSERRCGLKQRQAT